MTDWTDIHPRFADKDLESTSNQQKWESAGITYEEAKQWIELGFWPEYSYCHWAKGWKAHNLTPQQSKGWRDAGLKDGEFEFAGYLRDKGYHYSNNNLELEKIKKEFKNSETYLDWRFPQEQRITIEELEISSRDLTGILDLSDFVNLKKANCSHNKITKLNLGNLEKLNALNCDYCDQLAETDVSGCPNLEILSFHDALLNELDLSKNTKLTIFNIENNNFVEQNLSFLSHLVNLKELKLSNLVCGNARHYLRKRVDENIYNHFIGSLKPLEKLNHLETLEISWTDIESGLEYLPESIKVFSCLFRNNSKSKKSFRVKNITEDWKHFKRNLKKCKEFNKSARKWLDENYPLEKECQEETYDNGWDNNYGWNNRGKKREEIIKLDISDKNLEGGLILRGFVNLEKLDCSQNKITNLDLESCPKLVEINCSSNELHNLDFLKTAPQEKIEKLWIKNNPKLSDKNLNFLIPLTNLKELDISDSKIRGSLKPLDSLTKLEWLDISNTDIKEGLEYLPKNCKDFYCELDYQYGSVEIAKILSGFSESENNELLHTKYNLERWRTDKANSLIASAIPLERLFIVRGNLKQFINKWRKPVNDDWFDKLEKLFNKKESINELSKLQSPKELWKNRWAIYGSQFIGRGSAIIGAVLTFQDQGTVGGGILAVYPFTELIVSKLDERLKDKENEWKEFLNDADVFLDNYHELLAVTKSIKTSEIGKISQIFDNLRTRINEFLEEYDQSDENGEKNGEIELEELVAKRKELSQNLNDEKSKLWKIVNTIKNLEEKVIAYRQGLDIESVDDQETRDQTEVSFYSSSQSQSQQELFRHEVIELQNQF